MGDALVHLIGYPQYSASDREQVWRWVERERVLFRVVETACAKPASAATISSGARQACDVVSRILDRVAALPSAGRLASQTSSREFVEPLVRGTVTTDALMDQQEACAELLCKVLAKSEERLVVEQAKSGMFPPVDLTNGFAGAHRETLLDSTVIDDAVGARSFCKRLTRVLLRRAGAVHKGAVRLSGGHAELAQGAQ